MKKLTSMYKRYMFHPILYKTVTRTSIVAVLMLLWQRYVSDGTFTIWEAPGFLCGVVLLIWAWVDYLRLDGVTIHHLLEEFKGMGKRQKKIHSTRSIIDYADEKIVSFEELEPEERTYCSLLSNLVLGPAAGRCCADRQRAVRGPRHGTRAQAAGHRHSGPCGQRQDHPFRSPALRHRHHPQAGPRGP